MTADSFATRESQLREEISQHQRFLSEAGQDGDYVSQMIREQTEARIRFLKDELESIRNKLLEIRFEDRLNRSSMPTNLLANLLSRFQSALTFTGWALEAGPGIGGQPPAQIDRSTETEVLALTPGSFLIRIRKSSLELDSSLLDNAVRTVLELAEAAAGNQLNNNEVEEKAQLLGREPTRRLALFFKKLSESSLTTFFHWRAAPDQEVQIDPMQAKVLGMWLESMEERVREVSVTGILKVADMFRGRFAIVDQNGNRYEGKADPELLAHVEIEGEYTADIQIITSVADHTGATVERIVLLRIART